MIETGVVDSVHLDNLGSFLTADAALAATSITIDDLADFSEDGGWLLIAGQAIQYTSGDDDTGVLTLATGLAAAAVTGDPVYVYTNGQIASQLLAEVYIGDADDTVEVVVPISIRDRLSEGLESGMAVEVEEVDDTYVLRDVVGAEPVIDGAMLDPGSTIPPEALTDGSPPSSPATDVAAVPFGIRGGRIMWQAPTNPDPMTFRVYISDTAGVDDTDELAATTGSLSAVVDRFADAVLDPTKTYYAVVYTDDADGPGPA